MSGRGTRPCPRSYVSFGKHGLLLFLTFMEKKYVCVLYSKCLLCGSFLPCWREVSTRHQSFLSLPCLHNFPAFLVPLFLSSSFLVTHCNMASSYVCTYSLIFAKFRLKKVAFLESFMGATIWNRRDFLFLPSLSSFLPPSHPPFLSLSDSIHYKPA